MWDSGTKVGMRNFHANSENFVSLLDLYNVSPALLNDVSAFLGLIFLYAMDDNVTRWKMLINNYMVCQVYIL